MNAKRLTELFSSYMDVGLTPAEETELLHMLEERAAGETWLTLVSLEGKLQEEVITFLEEEHDESLCEVPEVSWHAGVWEGIKALLSRRPD
jgi:hypothetical protein